MDSVSRGGYIVKTPAQPGRAALLCAIFFAVILPGPRASNASGLPLPITVSAGTQSLTVPWHLGPVDSRWNPAVTVGTDRPLRSGERTLLYHTANVGFFQNYWWMTGLLINAEIGAGYKLPGGFHADLTLVLGYRGSHDSPMAIAPFVAAQWAVQSPFADEAPAMTHFFLFIGVRFNGGMAAPEGGGGS